MRFFAQMTANNLPLPPAPPPPPPPPPTSGSWMLRRKGRLQAGRKIITRTGAQNLACGQYPDVAEVADDIVHLATLLESPPSLANLQRGVPLLTRLSTWLHAHPSPHPSDPDCQHDLAVDALALLALPHTLIRIVVAYAAFPRPLGEWAEARAQYTAVFSLRLAGQMLGSAISNTFSQPRSPTPPPPTSSTTTTSSSSSTASSSQRSRQRRRRHRAISSSSSSSSSSSTSTSTSTSTVSSASLSLSSSSSASDSDDIFFEAAESLPSLNPTHSQPHQVEPEPGPEPEPVFDDPADVYDLQLTLLFTSVSLLKEMGYRKRYVLDECAGCDSLIRVLWTMLEDSMTFEPVAVLLEDIFVYRASPFDLTTIPNIVPLLESLSPRRLSLVTRLLAFVVEKPMVSRPSPETHLGNASTRAAMRYAIHVKRANARIIERNVALLLNVPSLLENMVTLLRVPIAHTTTTSIAASLANVPLMFSLMARVSEQGQFPRFNDLIDSLPPDVFRNAGPAGEAGLSAHTLSSIRSTFDAIPLFSTQASPLAISVASIARNRTETLFVLSCLIGSVRRRDVTARMVSAGFVDIAIDMMEYMGETNGDEFLTPSEDSHPPVSFCSIISQLLRVIHHGLSVFTVPAFRASMDGRGAAVLAGLLERAHPDGHAVSALASTLEVYIRMTVDPEVKAGVLSQPLLLKIIELAQNKVARLCSFDLLGSCIAHCPRGRELLVLAIEQSEFGSVSAFLDAVALPQMVDSNVFLRHLVCSGTEHGDDGMDDTMRDSLLLRLADAIEVSSLSVDNLCCLNTMVILSSRMEESHLVDQIQGAGPDTVAKLDAFIKFFYHYYEFRPTERASLVHSSRLDWSVWTKGVQRLHRIAFQSPPTHTHPTNLE